MKKSILFVLHRIGIGGSMTSMLNLLELLKEQGYEIDLFLMEHEGALLERAKNAANLLKEDIVLSSVICDKNKIINEKSIIKLFIRTVYVMAHKLFGVKKTNVFIYRWRAKKIIGKYENVIAFQENNTTDFTQYIEAKNKIAWIHTNYDRFASKNTDDEMQKVYDSFDKIVCVSEVSKNSMVTNLKNLEKKVHIIYNSLNTAYIFTKSREYSFEIDNSIYNFVSVGRFAESKRFDRIIDVSRRLVDSGFKFRWYIVGDGDLFYDIDQKVKSESLLEVITLLGAHVNPYPIIKAADYLVITSLYEAHPMVANEGLILKKPIISTAFSSVYEVIDDRKNGLICDNSTEGIYVVMKELLEKKDLRETIQAGAETFVYNNEKILTQVSELLI